MEMVKGDFHSDFLGGLNQKFSDHNGFFFFTFLNFILFNFTILYWFCHISK